MIIRPCLVVALLAVALSGCRDTEPGGQGTGPVLVLVAASTKDAVAEVAAAFTRETNTAVNVSADDSARLATQIVNGAPAHLFLSANEKWAEHVCEKGFADATTLLLGNMLVIVVPAGNPAAVRSPADLDAPAVKHIAVAGPKVPAGIYARQALAAQKIWEPLQGRIVAGDNVRATLAFVERGEADAGIVYATDAMITNRVEQVYTFAAGTHDPIRYPLVLLKHGAGEAVARRFYDFLRSPAAAQVFTKHGFTILEGV
jgi:molybdate transport system substrate-binding protein